MNICVMFPTELFSADVNVIQATSQKRAFSHAISFTVNYSLFTHSDVSYRFNGENDHVVLEFCFQYKNKSIGTL